MDGCAREEATFPHHRPGREAGLLSRLLSLRVGAMLLRNTAVSCGVFLLGLGVLYALVQWAGFREVPAAGIGFLVANSLHYLLGRAWIFRGTDRGRASGYALFLINAGVGLAVTLIFYAALLELTSLHYLTARVIVSLFAGLVVFLLNAVFNFRQV
ncbi:MAG TPA: GtrA family protein [Croceibacterium sp.]|nr:GtrA family protein [Croceibacterium sp.]